MSPAAQSYSRGTFDGCAACSDVALDAIIQSALYVVSHVAPEALGRPSGELDLSFRLRARLSDEDGADIAVDEIEVEQSISTAGVEETAERPAAAGADPAAHSTLEDYQAMIDRVQIGPSGESSLSGIVTGRLFAFERLVGAFEVLVGAC